MSTPLDSFDPLLPFRRLARQQVSAPYIEGGRLRVKGMRELGETECKTAGERDGREREKATAKMFACMHACMHD